MDIMITLIYRLNWFAAAHIGKTLIYIRQINGFFAEHEMKLLTNHN